MSDALLANLQRRIDELTTELATVKTEAKTRRIAGKALGVEHDALKLKYDALVVDRDALKVKVDATPAATDATIKGLEAKLRARDVSDKLAVAATGLADGVTLDKLCRAAGFDPAADGAESTDFAALVEGLRASDPYLFGEAAATGETPTTAAGAATHRPALTTEVPTGRGAPDRGRRQTTYTAAEVGDYGWQQRRPELVAAIKDGTAVLTA